MNIKSWFSGVKLKLLIIAILPLLGFASLYVFSNKGFLKLSEISRDALTTRTEIVQTLGLAEGSVHAIGRWMWLSYGMGTDQEGKKKFIGRSKLELNELIKLVGHLNELPLNEKSKVLLKEINEHLKEVTAATNDAIALFETMSMDTHEKAKGILATRFVKNLVPMTDKFNLISKYESEVRGQYIKNTYEEISQTILGLRGISIGFSLFILFFSIFIANHLSKKLVEVSNNLLNLSDEVKKASHGVNDSATSLSQAGTEQASSLQETAASVEELSTIVEKNANDADGVARSAELTLQVTKDGKDALHSLILKMEEISAKNTELESVSKESFNKIKTIVELFAKIQEKTSVINDIVFQTKLLSFNASVEAARAGEHGKGFAVVAEEVGKLASMSGEAASSITELLSSSKVEVEKVAADSVVNISRMVDVSRQKINEGVKYSENCSDVFERIFTDIETVTSMSHSIAQGSNEQAIGIKEINKAVMQLDQVTHINATNAENSAQIAKELNQQVISLDLNVQELNKIVHG